MTTTTTHPDVPLPEGTHLLCDESFEVWNGEYRLVWGDAHPAASTNFSAQPWATQLPDGSVPSNSVDDQNTGVHVDEVANGVRRQTLDLTPEGARGLAAALLAAADQIDGWTAK
ncbi:MAG: hypothetical protein QOH60_2147 [Mycobacterium sp.]|jgi:hypothetical protein|nr:hypothetical protein [Mycobacterium sp.]